MAAWCKNWTNLVPAKLAQFQQSWPRGYILCRTLFIFTIFFSLTLSTLQVILQLEQNALLILTLVTLVLSIVVTILASLMPKLRCTLALCVPEVGGRLGQKLILIWVSWLLLFGPLSKTMGNLEKTHDSLSCLGNALESQVNKSRELAQSTMDMVKNYVVSSLKSLAAIPNFLTKQLQPISQSLAEFHEAVETATSTLKNVKNVCDNSLNVLKQKCKNAATNYKDKCQQVMGQVPNRVCQGLTLCKTIARKTFCMNNIQDRCRSYFGGDLVDNVCAETVGAICPPDLSENVCQPLTLVAEIKAPKLPRVTLVDDLIKLMSLEIKPIVQGDPFHSNVSDSFEEIRNRTREEFSKLYAHFQTFLEVGKYLSILPLILVPISAVRFLYARLKMRSLQQETDVHGKNEKKMKKKTKKGKNGRSKILNKILTRVIPSLIFALIILAVERALFLSLSVGHTAASNVTLSISSNVSLDVGVQAGDWLKKLAQDLVQGLKLNQNLSLDLNLSDCLPEPIPPTSWGLVAFIMGLHLVICFLIIFEDFVMSKRVLIVDHFFPPRTIKKMQNTTEAAVYH